MRIKLKLEPQSLRANLWGLTALLPIALVVGLVADDPWWSSPLVTPSARNLLFAVIGLVAGVVMFRLTDAADRRFWPEQDRTWSFQPFAAIPPTNRSLLALAAFAGCFEEILFRAALVPALGVTHSAFVFALMHWAAYLAAPGWHMRVLWFVQIVLIGMVLGLVFSWLGLYAAIAMHFAYDVTALKSGRKDWQRTHANWVAGQL